VGPPAYGDRALSAFHSPPAWSYAAAVCGSGFLAVALTPGALRLAEKRGLLDHPGPGKTHRVAVPYLGGLAIVGAFAAVVVAAAGVWRPPGADLDVLGMILGLGVGLALLGLADDLWDLPILPRLAVEIGAGVIVWLTGTGANLSGAPGALSAVVTVVWVVGITNAFNLLDNVDGLSAGVAAIAALSLVGVGLINGQYFVPLLALALAGCAAGFLRHNFYPARIHMGDAGSLFLGFVLAVLCLRLRAHVAHQVSLSVPLIALAVPIFDTGLVVATRVRRGLNPFRGRADHASHRLVARGWSVPRAVVAIYTVSGACGLAAMALTRVDRTVGLGVAGAVMSVALVAAFWLASMPLGLPGDEKSRPARSTHRFGVHRRSTS
jgi:UDP-GlcNAc:undecaprenyl-phosphate/decaprenyl-phosphate GlcNAc-1-phosphate transferase